MRCVDGTWQMFGRAGSRALCAKEGLLACWVLRLIGFSSLWSCVLPRPHPLQLTRERGELTQAVHTPPLPSLAKHA